jgi:phage repressor protein C with HTH and peptisase S24 domain
MARRKTLPDSVQAKFALAERLRLLRSELYGERGGPELARRLGLPIRTWYNYESGVTVPAEVVLKIIELTSVEPMWLLHGEGPKFRAAGSGRPESLVGSGISVGVLLRTALQMLESDESARWASHLPRHEREDAINGDPQAGSAGEVALIEVDDLDHEPLTRTSGPRYLAARSEWLDAERDCRCIQVVGDAMAPILMDGAYVAFAKSEEPLTGLDGKMVVAWIDGQPVVRWFQFCDKMALLRAENPATVPNQLLLDLETQTEDRKFRRVLWINTPH